MATHMYECSSCGEVHKRHSYAEECCQPEVLDVWACDSCGEVHGAAKEADECCAGGHIETRCPRCARDFWPKDLNVAAIAIAGHCQTCNPHYTYEEQEAIEDLHYERTEERARVNA